MGYSRIFGSKFPEASLVIQEKQDVNDSIVTVVTDIEKYIKDGDVSSANSLLVKHKDVLEASLIDAAFINLLQEEIRNIGEYSLSKQTNYVSAEMPTTQEVPGSYWIQDYE